MPSAAVTGFGALLCVTLVLAGGRPSCSSHMSANVCEAFHGCEWCGNRSLPSPDGLCWDPAADNKTCCAALPPPVFECPSAALLCDGRPDHDHHDVCAIHTEQTTYGDCLTPTCCPQATPVVCGDTCFAKGTNCCGDGNYCNATQMCCGGGEFNTCCQSDGSQQCCSSYDGMSYWCCAVSKVCNPNSGGCDEKV